jgi:hypothetical protein
MTAPGFSTLQLGHGQALIRIIGFVCQVDDDGIAVRKVCGDVEAFHC